MSLSNAAENDILDLVFNGTTWDDVAENDTTSPATTYTLALHTADPGEAGDQTTNEATYGAYARQTVSRTSSGFTVSGNQATLTSAVQFPEATSGTETITHFSVGTGSADYMIGSGTVSPNISVSTGVTPELGTGTSISFD